jgi:uncharacterized membrane protein
VTDSAEVDTAATTVPSSTRPTVGSPERVDANLPPILRRSVAQILRAGVTAAGVLLIVGLVLLALHGNVGSWPGGFGGQAYVSALVQGIPLAYLLSGILVLVATPVVRVAVSAALFAEAQDYPFVAITLLVLGLILLTAAIGATP